MSATEAGEDGLLQQKSHVRKWSTAYLMIGLRSKTPELFYTLLTTVSFISKKQCGEQKLQRRRSVLYSSTILLFYLPFSFNLYPSSTLYHIYKTLDTPVRTSRILLHGNSLRGQKIGTTTIRQHATVLRFTY